MAKTSDGLTSRPESTPVDWRIRPLESGPQYLGQLAQWHHRECLRQGLNSRAERRYQRLQEHLVGGQSVPKTWLALDETGELVGCVSVVSYQLGRDAGVPSVDTPLWLSNLYVAPDWRTHGVGSALVTKVVDFTRSLGMRELWLIATEQTDFYRRRHWQRIRRARLGKQWVNVMRRSLDSA